MVASDRPKPRRALFEIISNWLVPGGVAKNANNANR